MKKSEIFKREDFISETNLTDFLEKGKFGWKKMNLAKLDFIR
jgi:hypothetical protein